MISVTGPCSVFPATASMPSAPRLRDCEGRFRRLRARVLRIIRGPETLNVWHQTQIPEAAAHLESVANHGFDYGGNPNSALEIR